jgi:hypothetical protein
MNKFGLNSLDLYSKSFFLVNTLWHQANWSKAKKILIFPFLAVHEKIWIFIRSLFLSTTSGIKPTGVKPTGVKPTRVYMFHLQKNIILPFL